MKSDASAVGVTLLVNNFSASYIISHLDKEKVRNDVMHLLVLLVWGWQDKGPENFLSELSSHLIKTLYIEL